MNNSTYKGGYAELSNQVNHCLLLWWDKLSDEQRWATDPETREMIQGLQRISLQIAQVEKIREITRLQMEKMKQELEQPIEVVRPPGGLDEATVEFLKKKLQIGMIKDLGHENGICTCPTATLMIQGCQYGGG